MPLVCFYCSEYLTIILVGELQFWMAFVPGKDSDLDVFRPWWLKGWGRFVTDVNCRGRGTTMEMLNLTVSSSGKSGSCQPAKYNIPRKVKNMKKYILYRI